MKTLLLALEKLAVGLMGLVLVVWLSDWAVFAVRSARGEGYDSVQVEEYLSTPLKGNKQEYDYMGTADVRCARAIFPRGGAAPCWWQRRHPQQWE
jgi:hypothetical protein